MKKEIRVVNGGVMQITTVDERWYAKPVFDTATGVPAGWDFVPSVTWIAGHYPKGIGFYKWLASTGWDESQAIRDAAGDKGSRVHHAISALLDGVAVKMDDSYPGAEGDMAPLSLDEWECLMAFVEWWKVFQPVTIAKDLTVFSEEHRFAGSLDWLGTFRTPPKNIVPGPWLIDFKTSQDVWPEHALQVSAYDRAVSETADSAGSPMRFLGILQLGYRRNKHQRWKFNVVDDAFDLFLAAQKIWAHETKGQAPPQRDYPLTLSLEGL